MSFFFMPLIRLYKSPALSPVVLASKARLLPLRVGVSSVFSEYCYHVQVSSELNETETVQLHWLVSETFDPSGCGSRSLLEGKGTGAGRVTVVEVGPRLSFTSAFSTNVVNVCRQSGLIKVERVERSRRFFIHSKEEVDKEALELFAAGVHDRMTEMVYSKPLESFDTGVLPEKVYSVPVLKEGKEALKKISTELGLAFDEQDLEYYSNLFQNVIGRDPTNVELFDMGQSNSEHSRHWFFGGKLVIDGVEMKETLFQLVKEPWKKNPSNSTIAFSDNSSALKGYSISTLIPSSVHASSIFRPTNVNYDLTFTAETHNFPTGICPFAGAETGSGGRIRDGHATGIGSLIVAGTAGYCVGNLNIPGYKLEWENENFGYPSNLAKPLQIEIEASDGASDYGNKFGEPLIQGFTRSFGLRLGERREWVKPIMFSGGIGQIDALHRYKKEPGVGMLVVKIGGPAYRIGMGGGAASSMVQGDNKCVLDFNAVQRGDAEMEQKVNRVIRACCELGDKNPIVSIHDQGAGGAGNVLKEIGAPAGVRIEIRQFLVGDSSLSVLELWGAEYQENDAILLHAQDYEFFKLICEREQAPHSVVGLVTGDGRAVVHDSLDDSNPVDLSLDHVLAKMPQKIFKSDRVQQSLEPLSLPSDMTIIEALNRVLRLLSVGSKRFLTSKVDRAVTGLIAQQQCVGPLHTPLADVAVIAQSHYSLTGGACSIGEQPIKGLIDCAAMARLSVSESLTNLVWAKIEGLESIKASGNWMWAAKLAGEGALMYDAAKAASEIMITIGMAIDGGKDSLSMAARCLNEETKQPELVKAPGTFVVSCYAPCPNITLTVTPDLKQGVASKLLFIPCSNKYRLGGSALAQVFNQIGNETPDVDDVPLLMRVFNATQELIERKLILAGHDRSDGGLITTILEMAFAGNLGVMLDFAVADAAVIPFFFAEEVGLVIQVADAVLDRVALVYHMASIPFVVMGSVTDALHLSIVFNSQLVLASNVADLRDIWEETSFQIESLQRDRGCVEEEKSGLRHRTGPKYQLSFVPTSTPIAKMVSQNKPRVAIMRHEGSNGDREMASAFFQAGFESWDVSMSDLLSGRLRDLSIFCGVAFVGGFANADVLDSGKGWAATIRFNPELTNIFKSFYERPDTFSVGFCNGCQLMALLGWVPFGNLEDLRQPRFIQNKSGRFESRFVTLRIEEGPCIFFKGMENSILGCWSQHGEGQVHFPEASILESVVKNRQIPARYVDDDSQPTEKYPFNPNGSQLGIAGLCSEDGRHFALMPHPERTFLKWQWAYQPLETNNWEVSPWLRMFQNARVFCESNQ